MLPYCVKVFDQSDLTLSRPHPFLVLDDFQRTPPKVVFLHIKICGLHLSVELGFVSSHAQSGSDGATFLGVTGAVFYRGKYGVVIVCPGIGRRSLTARERAPKHAAIVPSAHKCNVVDI